MIIQNFDFFSDFNKTKFKNESCHSYDRDYDPFLSQDFFDHLMYSSISKGWMNSQRFIIHTLIIQNIESYEF